MYRDKFGPGSRAAEQAFVALVSPSMNCKYLLIITIPKLLSLCCTASFVAVTLIIL